MKLPTGWKKISLDELAEIQTGIAKNGNTAGDIIEVPYLRVANVQDGYLDLSELKTINILKKRLSTFRLEKEDVLLTEGGDFDKLGRGAVWNGEIEPCVHQNHVFVVRPKKNILSSHFLSLQTGSDYGKKYFRKCSKQSTNLASINSAQLRQFPVILPTIPEQKAIASLLSTWDIAIEKTERLIAAKEKYFQALLDRLVFSKRNSDWNEVRLGKVFIERSEVRCADLPLLSIFREEGITLRSDTNRKDNSTEDKSKYLHICPGDIGYNTMRMWQGVSALSSFEGIVSPAYTVCIPIKEMIDGLFASFLFKHPWMIHQFYRHSQGLTSDTWNLKFHHFAEIKIWLPPLPKQKNIAAELILAAKEIALLKQKSAVIRQQKRGLMQKLLTGEWRILPKVVKRYEEATHEVE